jgi:hypothetical protein
MHLFSFVDVDLQTGPYPNVWMSTVVGRRDDVDVPAK